MSYIDTNMGVESLNYDEKSLFIKICGIIWFGGVIVFVNIN